MQFWVFQWRVLKCKADDIWFSLFGFQSSHWIKFRFRYPGEQYEWWAVLSRAMDNRLMSHELILQFHSTKPDNAFSHSICPKIDKLLRISKLLSRLWILDLFVPSHWWVTYFHAMCSNSSAVMPEKLRVDIRSRPKQIKILSPVRSSPPSQTSSSPVSSIPYSQLVHWPSSI